MKVYSFVISGRTAKEVSPTSPRVTLFRALVFTGSPSRGATVDFHISSYVVCAERDRGYLREINARSAKEYIAQIFGAQYA